MGLLVGLPLGIFRLLFALVMLALRYLPVLGNRGAALNQKMKDKLVEHAQYIAEYGVDLPEIADWRWKAI